jgi:cell division protein FtsZ
MMGSGVASGENRAREAAEAALRSPLLEGVNLQGARGILVNITGGVDLSLGDFNEVGETIEEFASPDATVVVGTVIDPELTDELRVTVVATGLQGVGSEKRKPEARVVVNNTRQPLPTDYDIPTVKRKSGHSSAPVTTKSQGENDFEYLDIPAFLRNQAD